MSTGSPRQLWLLPVLLITVIATALGALVARSLYTDQPPARPAAVDPAPSSRPLREQPGPPEVKGTADATTHPMYGTVRPLLQRYFDAINAKDYDSWASTVTAQRREAQPEDVWTKDYSTTRDGSIVVYRIENGGPDTARVLLQFTSTQDEANAPSELPVSCIHWNVVWVMAKERDEWKLSAGKTSASPQHEPCEGV